MTSERHAEHPAVAAIRKEGHTKVKVAVSVPLPMSTSAMVIPLMVTVLVVPLAVAELPSLSVRSLAT